MLNVITISLDGIPHTASISYGTRSYDYEDSPANCTPYDVQLSRLDHEDFGCTIISQNQRYISKFRFVKFQLNY